MLPSLLVSAALTAPGAPIPADATNNTTGPAPRVVAAKADAAGTVWITAYVYEKRMVQQITFVIENGKQVQKQQGVEQLVSSYIRKSLGDFGDSFSMADGTRLSAAEATRRVKGGATLLISADGKPIDRGWLRAVAANTVVLTTEGLAHAHFQFNQGGNQAGVLPSTATPRLARFCADESGAVKVDVNSSAVVSNGPYYSDDLGGARIIRGRAVMQNVEIDSTSYYGPRATAPAPDGKRLLSEVKFDAFTRDGKRIPRSEALQRLKAGGLVLLAGDTRFPDEDYLTSFREEMMVLVSGEFVFPVGQNNPYDMPVKKAPAAGSGTQPVPPPAGIRKGILLPNPAVQVQIAPAVIKRALPAIQVPPVKPVEKK